MRNFVAAIGISNMLFIHFTFNHQHLLSCFTHLKPYVSTCLCLLTAIFVCFLVLEPFVQVCIEQHLLSLLFYTLFSYVFNRNCWYFNYISDGVVLY